MSRLHQISAESSPGLFDLSGNETLERIELEAADNWPSVNDWALHLASQFPIDTLDRTGYQAMWSHLGQPDTGVQFPEPVYYKEADAQAWLAKQKKRVLEWIKTVLEHSEVVDVRSGQSRMRLLDLHCPAVPGCRTVFGRKREQEGNTGFRIEILGFGSGSKHNAAFKDTLVLSAEERCLEVWVPVEYTVTVHKYNRPRDRQAENCFYTVDPTGIGDDIEVKPAPCHGNRCSVIPPHGSPKATYTLPKGAKVDKAIAYELGSSMSTTIGVELPWSIQVGLEATISFQYSVDYQFELTGPGDFSAYEISYGLPAMRSGVNLLQQGPETTVKTLGYAWEWITATPSSPLACKG